MQGRTRWAKLCLPSLGGEHECYNVVDTPKTHESFPVEDLDVSLLGACFCYSDSNLILFWANIESVASIY